VLPRLLARIWPGLNNENTDKGGPVGIDRP